MIPELMDIATGKRPTYTKEPKIPITMYVPPELYERVTHTAIECDTSIAAFCRQALTSYLDGLDAEARQ